MNEHTPQRLEDAVLNTIQTTGLCPRSKWWYVTSNVLLWVSFVATVLLGALAVSVLIFAGLHGWYGLYELVNMTWLGYFALRVTLLWPIILVLTLGLAYYNFRCTRRGYRWSLAQVTGACIGLSILLGIGLHVLGAGYATDRLLQEHMPLYPAQDKIEYALWHQPTEGRLIGSLTDVPAGIFTTIDEVIWQVDTTMLMESDRTLLESGAKVHLVGTITAPDTLRACAAVAPMLLPDTSQDDLAAERDKRDVLATALMDCM